MDIVKRNYILADKDMLEDSKLKLALFKEDLADFQLFSSVIFHSNLPQEWQQAIDEAENTHTHEMDTDLQAILTTQTLEAKNKCLALYQEAKFFIETAFPNNIGLYQLFGFNNFDKAQRTQAGLIQFMKQLHATLLKHATELNTKGFTANHIENIRLSAEAFDKANIEQGMHIAGSTQRTQERIGKYNKVHSFTQLVCRAGKLIYRNNYGAIQRYYLKAVRPSGENTSSKEGIDFAEKTISANEIIVLLENNRFEEENTVIEVRNTGNAPLQVEIADKGVKTVSEQALIVPAHETRQWNADELWLDAEKPFSLLVKNIGQETTTIEALLL